MKKVIVLVRSRYEYPTDSNAIYLDSVDKDIRKKYPNAHVEFHSIDKDSSKFSKHQLIKIFNIKLIPSFFRLLCSPRLYQDVYSLLSFLDFNSSHSVYRLFVSVKIYFQFSFLSSILKDILVNENNIAAFLGFGYYSSVELSYLYASSFYGIDFVDYQHGIIHSAHTPYAKMSNSSRLRPSYMFVWDESFKKVFPFSFHSRIYLSSYSKLLTKSIASLKAEKSKKLSLSSSSCDITILISLCCVEDLPPNLFDFIQHCLHSQNNSNISKFILRLHPKTSNLNSVPGKIGNYLTSFGTSYSPRLIITDKTTSLMDDIASSDIHLTGHSSVAVQCSMCGVPTICFPDENILFPDCFELLPLIHRFDSSISIHKQISALLPSYFIQ